MDSRYHKILSIAIVCILAASAIWVAFAYSQETKEYTPQTIRTEVRGLDEFDNIVLDVSAATFLGLGYSKGDFVNISTEKGSVRGFTTENWQGLFTFEFFLNINSDGTIGLGCCCAELSFKVGDKITIDYIGPSDREKLMPRYFKSSWSKHEGVSDEEQINYRCVSYGDIAEGRLYRSSDALPMYTEPFADITNDIVKRHDADYLIDLHVDKSGIIAERELGLIDEDNAAWYIDDDRLFAQWLDVCILQDKSYVNAFKYIADNDGSYLLFCQYGKDRTGFLMIVLEALMGATAEEIIEDYSVTYTCLYGTPKYSVEYHMYRLLVIPQLVGMHDPSLMNELGKVDFYSYDISEFDLRQDAENYLIDYLGMTHDDVDKIRQHLSTPLSE